MLADSQDIRPEQLAAMMAAGESMVLLDVREADERHISVLNDHCHIPMGDIEQRCLELDPSAHIVVYCRSGSRSGQVARYLRAKGFKNVRNLVGGINAWARSVDQTLPTY